jgi:uncharacterized protein with PQ loop repeat
MFKKIQKYLLINYPLFWNTKIVPLVGFLIPVHIIFFIIGYATGALDFTETDNNYNSKNTDTVMFFSVLISIITIVLWLIYYFKNNGFKSFYPKRNWDLFKEWSMVFVISILLCSLHLSYLKGYDARIKSYYSEKEAKKRCETISKASIFYGDNFDAAESRDTILNDTTAIVRLDYIKFNSKKYPLNSLMNKHIENFSFFDATRDSLTRIKVKNWLANNRRDSVQALMRDYFKLIKAHKLTSNIDEAKWFATVYTPPTFVQSKIIAKREMVFYSGNQYDYATEPGVDGYYNEDSQNYYDTTNQYIKTFNNQKFAVNKTYLPAKQLEFNYEKISEAYINPSVSSELVLVSLYFALSLSILLFSFRVTSGRNWLIALIGMGIFNIILGIFSALISTEFLYMGGLLTLCLAVTLYFTVVLVRKTKKGISGIVLNGLLWLLPVFIPVLWFLIEAILRRMYFDYNNYNYRYETVHPYVQWMRDNIEGMMWLNLLFVMVLMLLLSFKIKKWKGIAES